MDLDIEELPSELKTQTTARESHSAIMSSHPLSRSNQTLP